MVHRLLAAIQTVLTGDGYWSAHPQAADAALVIEVSDSSLVFDLETKARLYAGAGIPHGWVIDGQQPCLHGVHQEAADPHARFVAELRGVAEQLVASLPPP